jgi:hypothetical protein
MQKGYFVTKILLTYYENNYISNGKNQLGFINLLEKLEKNAYPLVVPEDR